MPVEAVGLAWITHQLTSVAAIAHLLDYLRPCPRCPPLPPPPGRPPPPPPMTPWPPPPCLKPPASRCGMLCGADTRWARWRGNGFGPPRCGGNVRGIRGCHQHLRQQGIRIERNRCSQLIKPCVVQLLGPWPAHAAPAASARGTRPGYVVSGALSLSAKMQMTTCARVSALSGLAACTPGDRLLPGACGQPGAPALDVLARLP